MTQPQQQQAQPPAPPATPNVPAAADDNPRGEMAENAYKIIEPEELSPAERAAFEEAQRQYAAQPE